MEQGSIYDKEFVKDLFNRMSVSYERINLITSFGFSSIWRRQFLRKIDLSGQIQVIDIMTGMGENWEHIHEINPDCNLTALDFSKKMLEFAHHQNQQQYNGKVKILNLDILENCLEEGTFDLVVSSFGLKTFSTEQIRLLARVIKRILKPGGQFSFIEISKPKSFFLSTFYLFYLKYVIPLFGKVLLGNPSEYRMLGVYTENFGNCELVKDIFIAEGLDTQYQKYFYGCATGISGRKNK